VSSLSESSSSSASISWAASICFFSSRSVSQIWPHTSQLVLWLSIKCLPNEMTTWHFQLDSQDETIGYMLYMCVRDFVYGEEFSAVSTKDSTELRHWSPYPLVTSG